MPTVYGSWKGSGSVKGRITISYTRTYSADRTYANFSGDINVEFDQSISDSVNSWSVSGDGPNASGSNLAISFGSGGGTKKIRSFNDNTDSPTSFEITASVTGIEAVNATINATLSLPIGNLAPFLNNSNYTAGSITSSSAVISGISGNGNGTALVDSQVEYNTSMSDSGAGYVGNTGAYTTSRTITGLQPYTTYYYRARVQNSGWGWSAWGAWKSFTTASSVPGPVASYWAITNIEQTSAKITSLAVPDNNGSVVDYVLARVNTIQSDTGATDFTGVSEINMTGLIPGTTYWVRLIPHNANGYGPWTEWRSFTTLPGVSVNVGGVWKSAQPWVNVNGIWKPAVRYVNVGGVWKQ